MIIWHTIVLQALYLPKQDQGGLRQGQFLIQIFYYRIRLLQLTSSEVALSRALILTSNGRDHMKLLKNAPIQVLQYKETRESHEKHI